MRTKIGKQKKAERFGFMNIPAFTLSLTIKNTISQIFSFSARRRDSLNRR